MLKHLSHLLGFSRRPTTPTIPTTPDVPPPIDWNQANYKMAVLESLLLARQPGWKVEIPPFGTSVSVSWGFQYRVWVASPAKNVGFGYALDVFLATPNESLIAEIGSRMAALRAKFGPIANPKVE